MLAANRANARKSTGPRTAAGKRTSAMNALRSGFYSRAAWAGEPRGIREAQAFEALCHTLRVAVVAADNEIGERVVRKCVRKLWKAKRALDHWIEWESQARRKERQLASDNRQNGDSRRDRDDEGMQAAATVRMPYRMPAAAVTVFQRPGSADCRGWKVKVSVRMRWGRSPAYLRLGDRSLRSAMAAWQTWRARRRREHTVVSVTCTGHPWTPQHRQRLRTGPGCRWKAVEAEAGQGNSLMGNEAGTLQKTGYLLKCDADLSMSVDKDEIEPKGRAWEPEQDRSSRPRVSSLTAGEEFAIAKMQVQPTRLLKTKGRFLEPTMLLKTKVLTPIGHDVSENKGG
jgi:hypothetical protein